MPRLSAGVAQALACGSLILLIFLCLSWEAVLAPIRPHGSLLMLKALPLLAPLFGLLRGRLYTFRWTPFLTLPYLCEGIVRSWSEGGTVRALSLAETALSVTLLFATTAYVHFAPSPRDPPSRSPH
jgi:uncharacterized membrane protein